jgi:hypothetical protein
VHGHSREAGCYNKKKHAELGFLRIGDAGGGLEDPKRHASLLNNIYKNRVKDTLDEIELVRSLRASDGALLLFLAYLACRDR